MNDVDEAMKKWREGIGYSDSDKQSDDEYVSDILYLSLKPRWKWFKPPLWRIFMWAYKVDKAMKFTNCYPTSISTDHMEIKAEGIQPVDSIELTFTIPPFKSELIEKKAAELREKFSERKEIMKKDYGIGRGASSALIWYPDNTIEICDDCPDKPEDLTPITECVHLKSCSRAYHLGYIDKTSEEGSSDDKYRGNYKYHEEHGGI